MGLKDILEDAFEKYRKIMSQEIPYPDKVKQTILLKHETSKDISEEFLKDVYQGEDPGLKEVLQNYREKTTQEISNDLKAAQQGGWIRKDLNIEFILFMMDDIGKKLFDDKLQTLFPDKHTFIMELTNFFFYGIMSSNE
jgi:hypothetical protein